MVGRFFGCMAVALLAMTGLFATAGPPEFKEQIFFRNEIEFTGRRTTEGASAFFVERNSQLYVITAKHLLGSAMGVSPEVQPTNFSEELVEWTLRPNDKSRSVAEITGTVFPDNDTDIDIIYLTAERNSRLKDESILTIASTPVEMGMTAWLVGCPYSAGRNCEQNFYELTFVSSYERPDLLFFKFKEDTNLNLSGFSGAPILNEQGQVFATTYGGDEDFLFATLVPTDFLMAHEDQRPQFPLGQCEDARICVGIAEHVNTEWRDEETAHAFLWAGCKIGTGSDCAGIGAFFTKHYPWDRDLGIAQAFFEYACERTDTPSCFNLAVFFADDREADYFDSDKAMIAAQRGCSAGEDRSCELVKTFQEYIASDPEVRCEEGDLEMCTALGLANYYGQNDFEIDRNEGLRLLTLSCDGDFHDACGFLGIIYSAGDGIAMDVEKALPYLETGCNVAGLELACYNLGVVHMDGIDIPRNTALGRSYLRKACDRDMEEACEALR